jgi:hypothetical protein
MGSETLETFEILCSKCFIYNLPDAVNLDKKGDSLEVTNQEKQSTCYWYLERDENRASDLGE